jgi:membrane-bound lytic murein transglycosylase D
MTLLKRFLILWTALIGAILILGTGPILTCSADPFQYPPVIQPSVDFWLAIYTRYSLMEGVVHDSRHPEIIYDVIALKHPDAPEAHRINAARMRKARLKVGNQLDRLIRNPHSNDPDLKPIVDLWRASLSPDQLRWAKRRIRCQVGQRDRFREGLIRSFPHIETIRIIFRNAGLPEDLAYLAHVESSFNNRAHSKSGAAGIWQFTRETGRHYLRINLAIDERLDPIRASEAAAKLLKTNYRRLGSWPLAITAYNHGIAGMRRAKRRHKSYAAIFQNYRSRRFRFASRNFYPEFLAAREAAANAQCYFHDLPPWEGRPVLRISLNGFVPFNAAVRHFKLDADLLRQLNPALRLSVLNGHQYIPKHYALCLPAHEWQYHLAYNARIPQPLFMASQKRFPLYHVRPGDTLSSIAKKHDLRVADLVAANNLADRGNRIVVNQKLRLPLGDQAL